MDKILKEPPENRIIGFRQVRKAANNNRLRCVVIAMDTDEEMIAQITGLCRQKNIPYDFYKSRIEMGKLLKLDVACSVCGVKKQQKELSD
ncbi:MAG: L7Ae/L30e/S12e/Gadd45 family ribosomal protein [Christensenellales bacterium]|jgi:large subunit ribosomal protein L7A|nr:ribosomal L7Ae/L30e/S12e/Gadd45 family protein [Clostridiales bacterium]